jgi:hypothetical protein
MIRPPRAVPVAVMIAVGLMGAVGIGRTLASPAGTWSGHYHCAQGNTALDLTITPAGADRFRALFYFHALAGNPHVPPGCFTMAGRYDPTSGSIALKPTLWLLQPPHFVWVGLHGWVNGPGGTMSGRIDGPGCTDFSLVRVYKAVNGQVPASCRMEPGAPTV